MTPVSTALYMSCNVYHINIIEVGILFELIEKRISVEARQHTDIATKSTAWWKHTETTLFVINKI